MKIYIIVAILLYGNYAYAYDYRICPLCGPEPVVWSQSPTFYVHNSLGYTGNCVQFPTFVADYRHEINCATKAFNDLGSSDINISTTTDNEFITDDFQDESDVGFAPPDHFDDDLIGLTHITFNCLCGIDVSIKEADIKFNWSINWLVGSVQPNTYTYEERRSFRQVALHEIGHALGFEHYGPVPTVMNSKYINGGWYRGDNWPGTYDDQFGYILPHADDANGMNDLYGNSYVGRDIAMNRGYLNGNMPVDLPRIVPSLGCPGQTIQVTYTLENRGNEYLSLVPVRTFFSSNLWIGTDDYMSPSLIGNSLNPYQSRTIANSFLIPQNIPPGFYYVGIYADPFNIYGGEFSEYWNNAVNVDTFASDKRFRVKSPTECP